MTDSVFTWGTVTTVTPLRVRLDGDAVALPLAPNSLIDPNLLMVGDRVRCEIANRRLVIHGRRDGDPRRGTTAQRDAIYGIPATDPERVALANRKVTWFNTDLGWEEAYYAVHGTSGLTARGLVTGGPPAGWYPLGAGPRVHLQGVGSGESHTSAQEFDAWRAFQGDAAEAGKPGVGYSWRHGGTDWFVWTGTSYVDMQKWGMYDVVANMTFQSGSGTGVFALQIFRPSAGATVLDFQKPIPLLSGYGQQHEFNVRNVALRPGDRPHLRTIAASWSVGGDLAYLDIRYIGPMLVTA